jgi:mRNA interferase MazF
MKRGEGWPVRIPHAPGHAQTGERPAIVLQDEAVGFALPTVLIVPFTSRLAATRFPGTLLVQPDGRNGLTAASVALVFQLRALDKSNAIHPLGQLDDAALDRVFALLDELMGR